MKVCHHQALIVVLILVVLTESTQMIWCAQFSLFVCSLAMCPGVVTFLFPVFNSRTLATNFRAQQLLKSCFFAFSWCITRLWSLAFAPLSGLRPHAKSTLCFRTVHEPIVCLKSTGVFFTAPSAWTWICCWRMVFFNGPKCLQPALLCWQQDKAFAQLFQSIRAEKQSSAFSPSVVSGQWSGSAALAAGCQELPRPIDLPASTQHNAAAGQHAEQPEAALLLSLWKMKNGSGQTEEKVKYQSDFSRHGLHECSETHSLSCGRWKHNSFIC